MEMHSQLFLQALYDELVEQYEYCDAPLLEEVHDNTKKYMNVFLEAGFDATQIAKMMSAYDVWYNYDTLVSYGAEIDPKRFLKVWRFVSYYDFIDENWNKMVERGISEKELARVRFKDGCTTIQDVEYLIRHGVDVDTIFSLVVKNVSVGLEPKKTSFIFERLMENGLPKNRITDWFETEVVFESLIDRVIDRLAYEYELYFNIDITKYIKRWLDMHDAEYFSATAYHKLEDLPSVITPDKFLASYTADELLYKTKTPKVFERIANEFMEIGGDINAFAAVFRGKLDRSRSRILRDLGVKPSLLF